MTNRSRKIAKSSGALCVLLLVAAIAAPYFHADGFAGQIHSALKRALGREVEIGAVRFSLFRGPGFTVDNVVIHEDPAIGIEPFAQVGSLEARVRLWSLWTGRLDFSSIRLQDASINLVKTGRASEPGRWNFESLLNRNLISAFPGIYVRNGRINFKFADTKTVFYFMNTDVDVDPPARGSSDWDLRFSGEPARTDRPARGFGSLAARGRFNGSRIDLDLQLEKSAVGEMIALVEGRHLGIHGQISSRLHLSGPIHDIRISGMINVADIHRWDLMPPKGEGWPLSVQGRLNLPSQTLELESYSAGKETLPLAIRFRASDYLSQPHWGVALNWNRFPLAPLLEVARHMGAQIPSRLRLSGTLDGAMVYSGESGLQGELAFHDSALTIPDSSPVQFEHARLLFEGDRIRLLPAIVHVAKDEDAQLEGDYVWGSPGPDLTISTESMGVASLRSQVALAAVPWLEQVRSGKWSGRLSYAYGAEGGWTGRLRLTEAEFPLAGLAEPLQVASANAEIRGARVVLTRIRAQVGKVRLQGEYRYEPSVARHHRFRLSIPEVDAAELERVFYPTLRRSRSLLSRALNLGRAPLPQWLEDRHMEGTLQIGALTLAENRLQRISAHLTWDEAKVEVNSVQARLGDAKIAGRLSVNLRGSKPVYRLSSTLSGFEYKAGKVDAEGVLDTSGMGAELLANLHAQGKFTGRSLEIPTLARMQTVSGSCKLQWGKNAPRLIFSDLELSTEDEKYTGGGATQQDGSLLLQLTDGQTEMRMRGTLAQLHREEPAPGQ